MSCRWPCDCAKCAYAGRDRVRRVQRDNACQAMHDLVVWMLCLGETGPGFPVYIHVREQWE